MKIVFFGSSQYCLPILDALKKDLIFVITREDKPIGRKKILTPSPVKLWAQQNNIPVEMSLRGIEMTKQSFDLGIVADFGKIIPEEIFNKPRLKTFNIHFSKLPDLRGASPIQSTILRGDTTAWVTIFQIEKTLDTGPILWQKDYPIFPTETAGELYHRLFQEVAKVLPNLFLKPETWNLTPQVGQPTFCKKLTKEDGFIDWSIIHNSKFIIQTYNRYRAYYPWPGLWTINNGRRMKILKCHIDKDKLVLDVVQFEGEKPKAFFLLDKIHI